MSNESPSSNSEPLAAPVLVGTMGWGYSDWDSVFYPSGTNSKEYIRLYARTFAEVEIDSTFYGTPREAQVKHWRQVTPDGFIFCPKVPRLITHDLRLIGAEEPLGEFVRVMGLLGPKRGPMLLQFPPDFTRAEMANLQAFLPLLARLGDATARFAIEFRHRSWLGADVLELLRAHHVALAATDYPGMPKRFEVTTDFAYLRLIGRHGAYPHHREIQGDHTSDLQRWTQALRENLSSLRAAYVQCNNDYEGYGPGTADRVRALVGLSAAIRPTEVQGTLF